MQVKRLDLGADCVVLPERGLIVLHPDLDYAESLGALMGTLPDLHPEAAMGLVEQVTPRPRPEAPTRRTSPGGIFSALTILVLAVAVTCGFVMPGQAAASDPPFGPDWQAAVHSLGWTCYGDRRDSRVCRDHGHPMLVRGFRHDSGSVYVAEGPQHRVIFVFDRQRDADLYVAAHPTAREQGRAVVW